MPTRIRRPPHQTLKTLPKQKQKKNKTKTKQKNKKEGLGPGEQNKTNPKYNK